jgi:hypothetical protein
MGRSNLAGTKGLTAALPPVEGELPLDAWAELDTCAEELGACAEEPDVCGAGRDEEAEEDMDKHVARRVGDLSFCNQCDREPTGLIICSEYVARSV